MIPKIIHYIWLSNEPINDNSIACIASWMKYAKGYKIKRWSLKDFDLNALPVFVKEAISLGKWAFAADYLRLFILYKEGGIYLDSDVLMLKDPSSYFDDDYVSSVEYYDELYNEDEDVVDKNGNGLKDIVPGMAIQAAIMGSVPNHPFLKRCMDYYENNHFILKDGKLNTDLLAPHFYALFARDFGYKYINKEQHLKDNIHLYPSEVFASNVNDVSANSVMVHLCAGSWRNMPKEQKYFYGRQLEHAIRQLDTNNSNYRPFLSVIVLCYKVEKWLPQCLESLRRQDFKDFEVIMVDDGSPDKSGEICDAYCKMDKRFKVIHKANGGIIAARKDALNMARGLYAGSVDGDDWVSLNMYEKMCNKAITYQADFVQANYLLHLEQHSEQNGMPIKDGYYDSNAIKEEIIKSFNLGTQFIEVSLCRSILKTDELRKIMNNLDNRSGLCEDVVCMYLYAAKAKSLYQLKDELYHYRIRTNSCTSSLSSRNLEGLYRLFRFAEEKLKGEERGPILIKELALYFLNHCMITVLMTIKESKDYNAYLNATLNTKDFTHLLSFLNDNELKNRLDPSIYKLIKDKKTDKKFIENIKFYFDKEDSFR